MVLFLNDVGTWEVLLILVFILIFFGSKSIPGLARTMGRTIRQIKDASSEIQSEIKKSGNEMKNELNLKQIIEETAEDVKRPLDQYAKDIDDAVKYQPKTSRPIKPTPKVIETVEEEKPSNNQEDTDSTAKNEEEKESDKDEQS